MITAADLTGLAALLTNPQLRPSLARTLGHHCPLIISGPRQEG
jgi:hypothetical protein